MKNQSFIICIIWGVCDLNLLHVLDEDEEIPGGCGFATEVVGGVANDAVVMSVLATGPYFAGDKE